MQCKASRDKCRTRDHLLQNLGLSPGRHLGGPWRIWAGLQSHQPLNVKKHMCYLQQCTRVMLKRLIYKVYARFNCANSCRLTSQVYVHVCPCNN